MKLSYFRYILDKPGLAKLQGYEVTADDDPKEPNDSAIQPIEVQNRLAIVHDQFSLDSIVAEQIGFTVLPNREICIAGVKMAGQLMPKDPPGRIRFLLSLWEWIAPMLKSCSQASNEIRYAIVPFNQSKYISLNG